MVRLPFVPGEPRRYTAEKSLAKPSKTHPVRDKVLAALITAAVLSLIAFVIPQGWRFVFACFSTVGNWLISTSSLPNWLVVLMSLATLLVGGLAAMFVRDYYRPKIAEQPSLPTEINVYDIVWRWERSHGISKYNVYSFCPQCDFQVHPHSVSQYRFLDLNAFACENCGWTSETFETPLDQIESVVIRKIQQTMRELEKNRLAENKSTGKISV